MTKKIDELSNSPTPTYFKEIEQRGSVTGQIYHLKFLTSEDYDRFLVLQEKAQIAIDRLEKSCE